MKDLTFLKDNLIAHRGYHDIKNGIAENSIESFKRAVIHNYCIELDVHLLKDDSIIVFHDDNLKRVCNISKLVNDCTYDDIKDLKLFNTNSHIPLLEDVLKVVDGKVPILIETKYYSKYGKLEKRLMDILDGYKGKIAIQSFYPKSIFWFKKNAKNVPCGLLSGDFKNSGNSLKKIIGKTIICDILLRTDFISYNINAMPNIYISAKKRKKLILGWTVRNKIDYDRAQKYCDNLICENMKTYS